MFSMIMHIFDFQKPKQQDFDAIRYLCLLIMRMVWNPNSNLTSFGSNDYFEFFNSGGGCCCCHHRMMYKNHIGIDPLGKVENLDPQTANSGPHIAYKNLCAVTQNILSFSNHQRLS